MQENSKIIEQLTTRKDLAEKPILYALVKIEIIVMDILDFF